MKRKFTDDEINKIDNLIGEINAVHASCPCTITNDDPDAVVEEKVAQAQASKMRFDALLKAVRDTGNDVKFAYGVGKYFRKYDACGQEIFCVKREMRVIAHQFVSATNKTHAANVAEDDYLQSDGEGELPDPTFEVEEQEI